MILTVITPDDRPGMQRMLERELDGIENEILYTNWRSGLKKARGDFILLLEHDSAVERGSIHRMLHPFMDNPHYRKLVMVSPQIEFEDSEPMRLMFSGETDKNLKRDYHLTRVGSLPGAIIRRSSLMAHASHIRKDVTESSFNLSLAFWENGLRIMHDPLALYYSPMTIGNTTSYKSLEASDVIQQIWTQECIS